MREAHRQALICVAHVSKARMLDKVELVLGGSPYPYASATVTIYLHGVSVMGTINLGIRGDGMRLATSLLKTLNGALNA